MTPNSLFEKCSKKNAIILSNAYYIKLYANRVVRKKVYRSMIQFIPPGKKSQFYIVFDPEIRAKINNTWVKVRFMDSEPNTIYVFNLLSDQFITSLKMFRGVVTDLANRTKEDEGRLYGFVRKRNKIINYGLLKLAEANQEIEREKQYPILEQSYLGEGLKSAE